jgi:hypothetical protein
MKKYKLTEKLSTEAQKPAFLVGAVIGCPSFRIKKIKSIQWTEK